jgi:hypothetical protein
MLAEQWNGFDKELIRETGFNEEFYPFSYAIPSFKIEKKWSGFKTLDYVGCYQARKHKDSISCPKEYYAFLVLRNDGLIAKGINQSRLELPPQLPGTIIILKRHCFHHVIKDERLRTKLYPRFWIGVGQIFEVKPEKLEVVELFQHFLSHYKTKKAIAPKD